MSGEKLISLEEVANLRPIECPTRGFINFPCAICKECDIGEVVLTFGDGYLVENTVNSILIHLDLQMRDDELERIALQFLKNKISANVPVIQKGKWDEGDIAILLTDEMAKDTQLMSDIAGFIKEFPKQWHQIAIGAKRALTAWSEQHTKQLTHKFFKLSSTKFMK